ncbi:HEAT repeat domain-containing protein [Thermosynechococcus sp. FA-CM-4201]
MSSRRIINQLTATDQPDTDMIMVAAQHPDPKVRQCVAQLAATPAEILQMLANDRDENVRLAVAANGNTPADVLEAWLSEAQGNKPLAEALAQNLSASHALLKTLAQHPEANVRRKVAMNPQTPPVTLYELAEKFPGAVARNPVMELLVLQDSELQSISDETLIRILKLTEPPTWALTVAVQRQNWEVRQQAAEATTIPPELLETLAEDEDWDVRAAVAGNPKTPPSALETLAKDGNRDVRNAVRWNLQTCLDRKQ